MHVLTKIFIVLVSLLVVLLVPLVVTYAYNENSYQSKYQQATATATTAKASHRAAEAAFGAAETTKNAMINDLDNQRLALIKERADIEADLRSAHSELAKAVDADDEIRSQLATLAHAIDASQQLNNTLIDELRGTRHDALAAERRRVELDEALRETQATLDVEKQARRGLEEELQRLKDEHAGALADLQEYVANHGSLNRNATRLGTRGKEPTINLDCYVVGIRRVGDETHVEIDAGSRDGMAVDWIVPVGGSDGYLGSIRITTVDINRSVGVVELRNLNARRIESGDRVIVRSTN